MRLIRALGIGLLSAVSGELYITLCYRAIKVGDSGLAALLYFVSVFVVLLLLVSGLARFFEWGSKFSILLFLVGVSVGVVIDATSDKTMDRNIYPIEAVMWWIIFAPAIAIGRELGSRLRKNRQSKVDGGRQSLPARSQ
jgi:hypothetical protein